MRCCVSNCKNDSRHISKSQGITFHVFPTDPLLRAAWLCALNKKSWEPKDRSTVCSEHFLCEDLYETKNGMRKVRITAVPVVLPDTMQPTSHQGNPASLKACRICLAVDVKLFSIKKYNLEEAYETLTGLSLNTEERLPQKLCAECAQRLYNCGNFRTKSLRANSLMMKIIDKHNNLSLENIKSINRNNNRLASNLVTTQFEPNHCDLHVEFDETAVPKPLDVDVDIKTEDDEIYMNDGDAKIDFAENFDVKNDSSTDSAKVETENETADDGIDADNDDNYIQDDYSTDDTLPLKKCKEKQKVKKKSVKKVNKKAEDVQPKIDRRRKPFLNDDLNETLFTITDLTFEEQVAEILKRRESANYKNSVFKCAECFKGFLDEEAYNSHMTRHSVEFGEYQCDICKTHFKHPHALRKHITAHHTQRFNCNQCPYETTHRQTARLHERWHKGTKYKCPHCQDEFVKFTTYMGHIRIKHPSDFVCQLCGYSFVSEKGIQLHKKLKHRLDEVQIPEDGPFCELCNVRFVSAEALKRHISVSARHNTSDENGREANKPKKGRKSKDAKERGARAREKEDEEEDKQYAGQLRKAEGPIPCEQCGLQLEDSRAYHGHFRRMHPDKNRTNYPSMKSPCMCEVCGRMFQSYALLKDHTWVHTGERPFKCESCGKAFRMKQRLVAHRRVHSADKLTYGCALCGKQFSTHSNRQRHMFIHTGLKPFKCEMCGKGFKHASEKRAHITYVHLKKPWPKRSRGKRRNDGRTGPMAPQSIPTGGDIEMTSLWPMCEPKLGDMNNMIEDKPMYYNIKI
ncbi:zinc finger protein 708 [Amyelois transitella]|uniref:zinc finger protein 708 n=1 Tax=Amyelois transitella TaxID=680683 RepID=UPI00298F67D7|nr:zinc finger protein 708 [Amyelois transitella]